MAIKKYLRKTEDEKNKKINTIEIEERYLDQAENDLEMHVDKIVKFKLQNFFNSKFQLLRNFQRVTAINEEQYVKKSEMNEMIVQEIALLTQQIENQ